MYAYTYIYKVGIHVHVCVVFGDSVSFCRYVFVSRIVLVRPPTVTSNRSGN